MRRIQKFLLAIVAVASIPVAHANAATFVVDSNGGGGDTVINGTCDADATADVDCTLRAAIEEANATTTSDQINFNQVNGSGDTIEFVNGAPVADVNIAGTWPAITEGLRIFGDSCSTDPANVGAPCAIVPSGLVVNSPKEVTISGLAFSGGGAAIDVQSADGVIANQPDFALANSWFGLETLGAGTIPGKGVAPATDLLLEDVDGAQVGGLGSLTRNVFARQGIAIDILGADNTKIEGNTFGVMPDGFNSARMAEGASANGDNIEVTGDSAPNPDDQATGTVIGRATSDVTTPACDGPCNLIDGAGQSATNVDQPFAGVDLNGEPADGEIPADGARIVGNQIGGGAELANTTAVVVGGADGVEIGGDTAADEDRNIFGQGGVTSGVTSLGAPAASTPSGLLIQNNVLGPPGFFGQASLALQGSGLVLDNHVSSGGGSVPAIQLSNTSAPDFVVQGNVIGEDVTGAAQFTGSVGILLLSNANGNLIGGEAPGEGNLISDKVTASPSSLNSNGIRISGDNNEVVGNRIGVGSDGSARKLIAGIELTTDADGNTIGGSTEASENLISNVSTDAIRITGATSDGNEILRNRGAANGDLFIDLGDDGAGNLLEPNGPNAGAQAPASGATTPGSVAGTSAPGAVIRLFTKAGTTAGEVEGFLATATADGSGSWTATFPESQQVRLAAATATVGADTSELSPAVEIPAAVVPDTDAPETTITKQPKRKSKKRKAKFAFVADEAGATFECKLDKAPFSPCAGKFTKKVKPGKHRFQVRATDSAGNVDATPAKAKWKVKKPRRK